jgi:hypothetical protein
MIEERGRRSIFLKILKNLCKFFENICATCQDVGDNKKIKMFWLGIEILKIFVGTYLVLDNSGEKKVFEKKKNIL